MKQQTPETTSGFGRSTASLRDRYRSLTSVQASGLPKARVIVAFVLLVALVGAILIALSVNGTSSGEYHSAVSTGADARLLAGEPEKIRSDEWNVGVPWTISQVQQGLPATSRTFPGGADADLPFGLPDAQPATIMEPQNWGFLFLGVDQAFAWKWWIPALSLIAASFALMITLVPRRPLVAAGLSLGFFFSPFFQWWFEPSAQWPIVWGALTIAAIVWSLKSTLLSTRIVWALVVAYFTTVMAAGIYAPFIIPVVYVVLFFGIGQVIWEKRSGVRWSTLVARLAPIALAGAAGGAAILLWLHSKASVVASFLGTVYPGQRLTPTGTFDVLAFARTLGAAFSESLTNANGFLGINSSEASSFFLLGVFLVPAGIWIVARRAKSSAILPWTTIGLLVFLVMVLAFIFVPGWNSIAHLLFLDLSNGTRMRIGIGFASFVLVGTIAKELDNEEAAAPRRLAWFVVAGFGLVQVALAAAIFVVQGNARLWNGSPLWLVYAALSAAAIFLFIRRRPLWGTAVFLVVSVASSVTVNPLYLGVFDLRATAVSREIVSIDRADPGQWVGIGGTLDSSMLLESGVTGFNGTQGAPSKTMWAQVDPKSHYTNEWNRLAAINWIPGSGAPVVTNPTADSIRVTFDACSSFAQKHVQYVLSSVALPASCLSLDRRFALPHSTMSIYRVVTTG